MISYNEETPIMSLFMSRTIPFCIISQNLLFIPVYKIDANDPFPPCADMKGLQLYLMLIRSTQPFLSHANPLLEKNLNMDPKLPTLEAS